MTPDKTFIILPTVDALRSIPGQYNERYVWVLERNAAFRWVINSPLEDDDVSTIRPLVGGFPGAYVRLSASDAGAPLTDEDATITVGDGLWRTLPAATLTTDHTITLATTNAQPGMQWELTRLDLSSYSLTILNGGEGGGTLFTTTGKAWGLAQFDGANWLPRRWG